MKIENGPVDVHSMAREERLSRYTSAQEQREAIHAAIGAAHRAARGAARAQLPQVRKATRSARTRLAAVSRAVTALEASLVALDVALDEMHEGFTLPGVHAALEACTDVVDELELPYVDQRGEEAA